MGRIAGEPRPGARSGRAGRAAGVLRALAFALLLAAPLASAAHADDYDPKRAGHPLRVAAYVLHPVGVTIDYLLMRPAHWLVHHEPLRTLFGHTEG